jgi:hypothetical protein
MLDWPEQIHTSPKSTSLRVSGVERPSVMTMLQNVPAAWIGIAFLFYTAFKIMNI